MINLFIKGVDSPLCCNLFDFGRDPNSRVKWDTIFCNTSCRKLACSPFILPKTSFLCLQSPVCHMPHCLSSISIYLSSKKTQKKSSLLARLITTTCSDVKMPHILRFKIKQFHGSIFKPSILKYKMCRRIMSFWIFWWNLTTLESFV